MRLTENQYYNSMYKIRGDQPFKTIFKKWKACFAYILRAKKVGYTDKIIDALFWDFEMCNGYQFNREHIPKYAKATKQELIEEFCTECHYIADRASYDRLFRTHWLFREAYCEELWLERPHMKDFGKNAS